MIITFAVLFALVFIVLIVAGALAISYRGKVKDMAEERFDLEIKNYNINGQSFLLDWAQEKFECCGSTGSGDYNAHNSTDASFCPGNDGGVKSCHKFKDCNQQLYGTGCQEKIVTFVKDKLTLVGGVAFGIAFVQLLGIVFTCLLVKASSEYERYGYERIRYQ